MTPCPRCGDPVEEDGRCGCWPVEPEDVAAYDEASRMQELQEGDR
jgi:hypothetical protein